MRFADDPVQIHNSHIQFENFELFASNGSPLDISGYLDFSNLNKMQLDAQLRAMASKSLMQRRILVQKFMERLSLTLQDE